MKALAAFILLLGVVRHNLWEHFKPEHQALAWNALSALVVAALLYIIWSRYKSPLLTAVVSWFLYEESLVAICSTWRILDWWAVPPGSEQCSARFGVHLGAASLVAIGWLAAAVYGAKEDG